MATSPAGRFQLSAEKAYIVSAVIPRSGAASTARRTASAPARWPAPRGRPRRVAQRPLPSMMIATCREALCFIKPNLKKKRRPASAGAGGTNQGFHVVEITFQRAPALRPDAVLGLGDASRERLHALHVVRVLELTGVDAEIPVRCMEQGFQLVEGESVVDRERADDAEAHALVDQAIELRRPRLRRRFYGPLLRTLRRACGIEFSHRTSAR